MRVKVKDFNCIREAEFQFLPGLTVLQGESNGGKSSVFRAIENTIFNQSGTANVQHGKQFYLVGIENNGHKVVFKKGKAGGVYKVDDVEYSKVGVGQVEQVADALGIRETVLAGEKIRLNFWSQMGYPFLLDRSPGQLYKFIVDSSESESLSSVLKDIAKDIKDTNASIVANDSKLDLLHSQLTTTEERLRDAEKTEETCKAIIAMDSEYNFINSLDSEIQVFNRVSTNLVELQGSLITIPNLDTSTLDVAYQDYQVVPVVEEYQKKSQELHSAEESLSQINSKIEIIQDIDNVDISVLNTIQSAINEYNSVMYELSNEHSRLGELDLMIEQVKEELKEFKVCPLCGGEIHEG